MAKAGFVLGLIGTVFTLTVILICLFLFGGAAALFHQNGGGRSDSPGASGDSASNPDRESSPRPKTLEERLQERAQMIATRLSNATTPQEYLDALERFVLPARRSELTKEKIVRSEIWKLVRHRDGTTPEILVEVRAHRVEGNRGVTDVTYNGAQVASPWEWTFDGGDWFIDKGFW